MKVCYTQIRFFLGLIVFPFFIYPSAKGQENQFVDSLYQVYLDEEEPGKRFGALSQLCRYTQRSSPELGRKYALMYDSLAHALDSTLYKGRGAILIGTADFLEGNFEAATTQFLRALDYFIIVDDTRSIGAAYTNLSAISWERRDTNTTIEYLKKAQEQYMIEKDPLRLAISNTNIGSMLFEKGEYDEAREYLNNAIEFFRQGGRQDETGRPMALLAHIEHREGNFRNAISQANEALKNLDVRHGADGVANIHLIKSEALMKLGDYPGARQSLEVADQVISLNKLRREKVKLYSGWTKYYEGIRRFEDAFASYKKLVAIQDSLLTAEKETEIEEIIQKYENEKKTQEINTLNAENEIASTKLRAARKQTYGLLAGLLIFAGLLFVVFRLFSKTKVQNAMIKKALGEKDILIREIHHRVKNNLQFISSLLGLQTEHIADQTALSALQEGQDRVQSMAIIHQNLYQEDNLTGVEIKDYFIKLIRHLFDSYNIRPDQIQLELDIDPLNLDVDTVIPIGLIVNELVSNALKYAFTGQKTGMISVSLKEKGDLLQLKVTDDGKGMTEADKTNLGSSFGYRLIYVFKDQLNADLDIDSSEGTTVNMSIRKFRKVA